MGDFLSGLGKVVNEQFGFGENSLFSKDNPDRTSFEGALGGFSKKIDHSEERVYVENGLINNIRPMTREVIHSAPEATIIVRKKMFSSLIENNRLDILEEKERLFIRASKKLFENKCKLISAYERLTKVEKLSQESNQFNTSLLPSVLKDINEVSSVFPNLISEKTKSSINELRRAISFSDSPMFTTWVRDYDSIFGGALGDGTGVIEFTSFSSFSTRVTNTLGGGNCSFSIEDPYKLMHVTQADIDRAISDAQNFYNNSVFGRFANNNLTNLINELQERLNNLRADRRVSTVKFIVSPQSLISSRLRAILDMTGEEVIFDYNSGLAGIGNSVKIDDAFLSGASGFTDEESSLFSEIVSNIYTLLDLETTTRSKIRNFNSETNYVRNKMRLMFKGKSIIQSLDEVTIFLNTNTTIDDALNIGFPGLGDSNNLVFGQKVNNLIRGISDNLSFLSTSSDEIEKSAIVGSEFPMWLWRLFRNNFTKQGAGLSVFVGLVKSVSQSYSSGKYTVSVSCEDNSGNLNKSQINVKPALDVFNSNLYDPLTPFDVSYDASSGADITSIADGDIPPLLPENQKMLETRALKFSTTDFKGERANQLLYRSKKEEVVFGKIRRVLADSEGFVYRWKQGINAITMVDRASPSSLSQGETSPKLTVNPFAGQDVMNVLSLLVTGQPYNFNTFLQSALSNLNNTSAFDPAENSDGYTAYIDGLTRDLSKRNVIWGNFIPFQELVLNDSAYSFIKTGMFDLTKRQGRLQSLLRKRGELMDRRALLNSASENTGNDVRANGHSILNIDKEISLLDLKIGDEADYFSQSQSEIFSSKSDGSIKIIGDDISFESSGIENGLSEVSEEGKVLQRSEMRRRINSLTKRLVWKVRANDVTNYFIVDDQYNKNYDIQAFERKIGASLDLFNSEYLTVDSKVQSVADILGLEVYADSQGNIRAKPPSYNKMPSSVFYRMFKERDSTGVKVFPEFLESLLFNQVESLKSRLEIIEDEIRLRVISLGITASSADVADKEIQKFLRGSSGASSMGGGGATGFVFITDPVTGKVPGERLQFVSNQSSPDIREEGSDNNLKFLEDLDNRTLNQLNVSRAFDISARVEEFSKDRAIGSSSSNNNRMYSADIIRDRLLRTKNVRGASYDELFSDTRHKRLTGNISSLDTLKIMGEVSSFVAERQRVIKDLNSAVSGLKEGLEVNNNSDGAKTALMPFLNRKTTIPSILEHMIEDETLDDLGPGSGKRYVIRESQIVSLTINETPPKYTAVQVNGLFAEGLVEPATGLSSNLSGASGGNQMTTAYAVDYDMWYQYGFKIGPSIPAPWASDPVAQCAPFAVSILNRYRKNILNGDIKIRGYNEYYQVGDVVYIESYDLLFYVSGVNHSFSYSNSGVETTLTLEYGHSPGEYIPTPLDIIGKNLYNSQTFSEKFRSARFGSTNEISVGAIIAPDSSLESILIGPNGSHNRNILTKALYSITGAVNPSHLKNVKPTVQIRIYSGDNITSSKMLGAADSIKKYLINPQMASFDNLRVSMDLNIGDKFRINSSDIISPEIIDIDTDTRSPSRSAWNLARLIDSQDISAGGDLSVDKISDEMFNKSVDYGAPSKRVCDIAPLTSLDRALIHNVIDIFVVYEKVGKTEEKSDQKNQAAKDSNARVDNNIKKRVN